MLQLPILLSTLSITQAADTVWWHTGGGTVTQHSDGEIQNCALTVENDEGQIAFVWNRNLPASIMVTQRDWNFSDDQTSTVALRIGKVWLENGNGTPNIAAMTARSALMVVPDQPFDNLLSSASEFVIKTPDAQFELQLSRAKMTALVKALRKCLASIGLRGGEP